MQLTYGILKAQMSNESYHCYISKQKNLNFLALIRMEISSKQGVPISFATPSNFAKSKNKQIKLVYLIPKSNLIKTKFIKLYKTH